MTERIIFCLLSCVAALSDLPHREVLRLDDGIVAAVPDETVLALLATSAPPSLLYYSAVSYEDAMRGLSPGETEEAVRKRLREWAPAPLSDAFGWLFWRGRECLNLAALSRRDASSDIQAPLDAHIDSGLELLSTLVGGPLYADVDLAYMLKVALELEAAFVAELNTALDEMSDDSPEVATWRREIEARETYGRSLGEGLAARGQDEFRNALPFVDLERVAFVTPRDERVIARLNTLFKPFINWKDGLVAEWSLRDLARLESGGKTVLVLYLDKGEFSQDIKDMTAAQRELIFERRAAMTVERHGQLLRDHLNHKRLELALFRRDLRAHASRSDEALAEVLRDQIAEETETLVSRLVEHPTWLPAAAAASQSRLDQLQDCETRLVHDADFLRALARLRRETAPEKHLGAVVARNGERLTELSSVAN